MARVFSIWVEYLDKLGITLQADLRDSLPCFEIWKGDSSNSISLYKAATWGLPSILWMFLMKID